MYMSDSSQLQNELLRTIAELLSANSDYLAFRATCKSWRSAVEEMPLHYAYQLPLLTLPYDKNTESYSAFSLSDNKIFYLKLSEAHGLRYCGSSINGWLVAVEETPISCLLNPFTKARIHLPLITTFSEVLGFDKSRVSEEYSVRCLFHGEVETPGLQMDKNPLQKEGCAIDLVSNPDYVVMGIHGGLHKLAFCRHGDKEWSVIEKRWCPYQDILHYKEQFYVVDCEGRVASCNIDGLLEVVEVMPEMKIYGRSIYLVESLGELLQVIRYLGDNHKDEDEDDDNWTYYTVRFKVFKLDICRGEV